MFSPLLARSVPSNHYSVILRVQGPMLSLQRCGEIRKFMLMALFMWYFGKWCRLVSLWLRSIMSSLQVRAALRKQSLLKGPPCWCGFCDGSCLFDLSPLTRYWVFWPLRVISEANFVNASNELLSLFAGVVGTPVNDYCMDPISLVSSFIGSSPDISAWYGASMPPHPPVSDDFILEIPESWPNFSLIHFLATCFVALCSIVPAWRSLQAETS